MDSERDARKHEVARFEKRIGYVPDPDSEREDLAEVERRRKHERERHETQTGVQHASDADVQQLVQASNRLEKGNHPIEQKKRLADYVYKRVRCPGLNRAEAEKAAGYVLEPAKGEAA